MGRSISPYAKKISLRFYEDQVEKKELVDNILVHSLVNIFFYELRSKERENELCLEWNSLYWKKMASQLRQKRK